MCPKSKRRFDLVLFLLWLFLLAPTCDRNAVASTADQDAFPNARRFRPHFTDVSQQAGVDHAGKSVSAIWLDYNDDGWLDLFLCNGYNQPNVLYRNLKNGSFEDVTAKVGLVDFRWSLTAHWIDLDNDGNFELCVQNKLSTQVFRKTDQDSFINITDSFGFLSQGNLAWADFNNDGLLDVYICRADENQQREGSPPNLLYKNIGNGRFEEIAGKAGVAGEGDSHGADWIDFDNDGFLDLHVMNDNRQPDHLYRNNGNETFTDVMSQSGIAEHDGSAYWADFNNDSRPDVLVNDERQARLYKNCGHGKFTDITATTGIIFPRNVSLRAAWIDFDNDGALDLFFLSPIDLYNSRPTLYRNHGAEIFADITHEVGLDRLTSAYLSIWADYDNDGDPDLYLPSKGANLLFRNDGGTMHWIAARLLPVSANRSAIGTSVTVVSSTLRQTRHIGLGHNARCYHQTLLFGIGPYTIIDSIIVRWPTGMVQDTTKIDRKSVV